MNKKLVYHVGNNKKVTSCNRRYVREMYHVEKKRRMNRINSFLLTA